MANLLGCYSGTQAAIRAGYSKASAGQIAYENLRKPHVADAFERGKVEARRSLNLERDAIIPELANLAFARHDDLWRSIYDPRVCLRGVRVSRARVTNETRVVDYKSRLEALIAQWQLLDEGQASSVEGRNHAERTFRWLLSTAEAENRNLKEPDKN